MIYDRFNQPMFDDRIECDVIVYEETGPSIPTQPGFVQESKKTHYRRFLERNKYDPKTGTYETDIVGDDGKKIRVPLEISPTGSNHMTSLKNLQTGEVIPQKIVINRKTAKSKNWNSQSTLKHEEGHVAQRLDPAKYENDNKIGAAFSKGVDVHGDAGDELTADKYSAEKVSKRSSIKHLQRLSQKHRQSIKACENKIKQLNSIDKLSQFTTNKDVNKRAVEIATETLNKLTTLHSKLQNATDELDSVNRAYKLWKSNNGGELSQAQEQEFLDDINECKRYISSLQKRIDRKENTKDIDTADDMNEAKKYLVDKLTKIYRLNVEEFKLRQEFVKRYAQEAFQINDDNIDAFMESLIYESDQNAQVDDFEHMKQVAKELFDTWSNFKYGIPKNGEIIDIPPGDYFEKHYKFLTPDQFEKYGGGVCWDYVEWGDRFLREKDVNVRKFYIWTETPPNWETHTFLVIDCGDMNRYVYIESSFKLLEGVWIHNSIDEIIDTITWNMFKSKDNERRFDQFRYVVFEYTDSHPEYGCTSKQYMQWMADHGKVIKEGYAKKDTPPAGVVQEAKLSTDDRNDLEDNQFGIPELRKYPLTDEKHVLQAVRFFNKAPDEYKEELARNIVKRAKELDMDWENWESLKPYLEKNVQKGVTDLIDRKLKNVPFDKLYFASPINYSKGVDLTRPLFLTPYKGIASIFCLPRTSQDRLRLFDIPRGAKYNMGYDEWNLPKSQLKEPLDEVHVRVEGVPDLKEHIVDVEGYIHELDVSDLKDHLYIKPWMTDGTEMILKDVKHVNFDKVIHHKIRAIVKGYPLPKRFQEGVASNGLTNARLIALRIHEQTEKDSKPPTTNQNCLLCTWCAEAQFRGMTSMPRPVYSPRDSIFNINGWDIVIGPNKTPIRNKEDVIKKLTMSGEGARYYTHVKWKGGSGGHEFLLLNLDGNIYVMDAQQGFVENVISKEGSKYFDDADYKESFICRLDNKEFNQKLFDENNDRSKTLKWNDKLDIPYMRKHGMLGEDDDTICVEVPSQEALKYLKSDPELKQYWETLQNETVGEILVDPKNGNHIGHVFVWHTKKNKGFIFDLEVKSKYRRQGYGSKLINDAVLKYNGYDLTVEKTNTPAINLYKKYGFEIIKTVDSHLYHMKLKCAKNIQADNLMSESYQMEGAWQDIKNGVNPYSDKLVFHVSTKRESDGQVWKPRVPEYLTPYDPSDTGFEDNTTARICFSPSIEGALNALFVMINPTNAAPFDKLYVYIPEKPWKEYKHKTNKEIINEKLVYDANVTREVWITEPVRMKLYGVIHVDQTSSVKRKDVVPTTTGKRGDRFYFTYKWHWVVKPKVIAKAMKSDHSIEGICEELSWDLSRFKYGLIVNGSLTKNVSEEDFNKQWVFHSGNEVDQAGGGNCYDMVEYSIGFLDAYGISCKKYFMEFTDAKNKHVNAHTICVVPNGDQFIYIEGAFKPIISDMNRMKTFQSLSDIFQYVFEHVEKHENTKLKCKVFDYTDEKIDYGTPINDFEKWISKHCKCVYTTDNQSKPVKEGYAVSESYRNIQSFLGGNYDIFQEADADTKKKTNDDLDDDEDEEIEHEKPSDDTSDKSEDDVSDNVGDDDDLDLSDFGNNGGDDLPNNEYDPKEVETLNALIASEAAALSEYMDAAKASHVDVLQRLYSDIGDEERFHMEQLLFAKSELTGEEYIPRDKDVKKEYEELLAMGMDEESAMATAVDKVGVRVKVEENMEDMDADAESIEKDVEMLEAAVFNAELLMTILEQAEEDRDQTLMNQIAVFTESFYQQEAVMNAGEAPKEVTAPFNPIAALIKLLMQVGSLLASLIHKFKQWIVKTKVRRAEMKRWFDNHGWEGFFSKGVSLYIWDDITGFQFDQMAAYINGLFIVAKDCGREAKLGNKYMEVFNETAIPFDTKVYNVRNLPNREQVLRDLQALTLTTTKVVVNKNNQEQIINEWFGYTDETMISKYHPKNGDTYLKQSKNAYNKLAYLLDAAQFYNNKTSDMMKGYQEQNGVNDKNSLWYTNRKAYNDNYAALKAVVKGYSTLSKCFTHDLKWMMWLINDGTYQQTEQSDKANPDRKMDPNQRAIFKDKQ